MPCDTLTHITFRHGPYAYEQLPKHYARGLECWKTRGQLGDERDEVWIQEEFADAVQD